MALARKCDRCGKLYEIKHVKIDNQRVNSIVISDRDFTGSYSNRGIFDLCPECLESFVSWLHMGVTDTKDD